MNQSAGFSVLIFFNMVQAEVLERAEGIKREYNELDTVWFMAGSLFQVFDHYIYYLRLRLLFFSFYIWNAKQRQRTYIMLFVFCSNTHLTYQLKLFHLRFSNRHLLPFSPVWCIYK